MLFYGPLPATAVIGMAAASDLMLFALKSVIRYIQFLPELIRTLDNGIRHILGIGGSATGRQPSIDAQALGGLP